MIVRPKSDTTVQSSIPTPEQIDALIPELQRIARKPSQIVHVSTEPPSESDLDESTYALLPTKPKRRYPRSGVFITDPVQKKSTLIEHGPFPEPIPIDEDFQSPIVEEEVIPSEGAQASGSSFETPELDISKGKSRLLESDFVDVVQFQNRVFDLESNSSEKYLIIGNGLTALFFDLKQRLFKKFGDEFQPLSVEGEKITASSTGPANPTSRYSSERAIRPAPVANLHTF
ncbi:unnamed protein product [Lactuca saligna]|uniref:Uncharacterized protein n=1 Tax=Lactuca saligna TaxID=75948 RepID=A0AA35VN25_LACSI|nr:unnamed protein product [Lactuca saligna]